MDSTAIGAVSNATQAYKTAQTQPPPPPQQAAPPPPQRAAAAPPAQSAQVAPNPHAPVPQPPAPVMNERGHMTGTVVSTSA
jgi:hypothetical protein